MRNRLNPDGATIRSLRIQRGWTQEQLAEIAGVSPRTVQRAETADAASFDTVRAIAGAFECDFDRLLRNKIDSASDPEPQITNPGSIPYSEPDSEPIPANLSKTNARRSWAMPLLLVGSTNPGSYLRDNPYPFRYATKALRTSERCGGDAATLMAIRFSPKLAWNHLCLEISRYR
jgi:transcriptional regulator with XRE-family HTH domain